MTDASASSSSASLRPSRGATAVVVVPSLGADETAAAADEAFRRHTSPGLWRGGSAGGVVVVWFRNDLRVLDNEVLVRAWAVSQGILPVYCVDPRLFGGGTHTQALRALILDRLLGRPEA